MTKMRSFTVKKIEKKAKLAAVPIFYELLYRRYGPQGWWPGDTRFEIIVGAILTQNTAWVNVEKAIKNLKAAKSLTIKGMKARSEKELADLIRPAGYYNVKAKRLKHFITYLYSRYGGSLDRMAKVPLDVLRPELLAVHGIGPETCDSILLYAFTKETFVIDAYTKRIFERHGLVREKASYHELRRIFMDSLPRDTTIFNEYHALIVRLAKEHCRSKPICAGCPLAEA